MSVPPEDAGNADDLAGFLLNPEGEHAAIEQRLTAFAADEVEAFDKYFMSQAPAAWPEARAVHALSLREDSWKSMWPARVAARLLLVEKSRGNAAWQDALRGGAGPLRLRAFEVPRAGVRNVVVSGGFLDVELARSHHPSITGARMFCATPDSEGSDDLIERYRRALALLEKHDPRCFSIFAASVSAIAPLQLDPPLEPGKCVSLSISAAPGVVLLTMIPIVLLAETLLHEAAHCRLSAAEDLAKMWISSGLRVASPLRPDPRPIAGLYHQAYVVYWLLRFYQMLREDAHEPAVQRNGRQIDKRVHELTSGFRAAVSSLRSNRPELTPFGARVLEEMASAGGIP